MRTVLWLVALAAIASGAALLWWLHVWAEPKVLSESDAKSELGALYEACVATATASAKSECKLGPQDVSPAKCRYAARLSVPMCTSCVAHDQGLWDACYEAFSAAQEAKEELKHGLEQLF